jgi:hypothetical protein
MKHPIKGIVMDAVTLEMQYFMINPTPINEDISVSFNEAKAPGLSHPFFQYIGGEADEISFDIEIDDRIGEIAYTGGMTADFIAFMQRFRPAKSGKQFSPPPPIIVAYGQNYFEGLVTSMKVTKDRFDSDVLKPTKATISITIKSLPVDEVDSNTQY